MDDPPPSFNVLLRRYRAAAGLTQDELAERARLSARAVSDLERFADRKPRKETVALLETALGLAVTERAHFHATARRVSGASMTAPCPPSNIQPAPAATRMRHRPILPLQVTSLVGREREVATVQALLMRDDVRLLTLTGPGGVGKTRVALQVAEAVQDLFPDGVFFVALAPVRDPTLVAAAINRVLGITESRAASPREALLSSLRAKRLLLALDNVEHLGAATPLFADLLSDCQGIRLLATSRALLSVSGEQVFSVRPLAFPDPHSRTSKEQMISYAAVRLFAERARAIKSEFEVIDANATPIVAICARLDGLPLAIELAVARLRMISPGTLLARLERRLPVLAEGPRDLPERQWTLRNTITWSYDLLNKDEQALFRRLAVFAGRWTLDAAEHVCAMDGTATVFDGLASLVDKSLIGVEDGSDGEPRFGLLETVRDYAWEQLETEGEARTMRDRHLTWCVALAREAAPSLYGAEQEVWLARLEREHDNLRAALRWSTSADSEAKDRATSGVELAGLLWRFWFIRGYLSEGRRWLGDTLVLGADAPAAVRAMALNGAGNLAHNQGDFQQATALHEESLALRRAVEDRQGIANSLGNLGRLAHAQDDFERSYALFAECLALQRELGNTWGIATTAGNLGNAARRLNDLDRAVALHDESQTLYQLLGDKSGIARQLSSLGLIAQERGDEHRAWRLYEESLVLHRDLGNEWESASVLNYLGSSAYRQGNYTLSASLHDQSLSLFETLGDAWYIACCMESLALVATAQRQAVEAATLLGASTAVRTTIDQSASLPESSIVPRVRMTIQETLSAEEYAMALAAGRALSREQAVALAHRFALENVRDDTVPDAQLS